MQIIIHLYNADIMQIGKTNRENLSECHAQSPLSWSYSESSSSEGDVRLPAIDHCWKVVNGLLIATDFLPFWCGLGLFRC